ncbi:hypothetical protein BsWGS_00941 [Bradybaena similaris]
MPEGPELHLTMLAINKLCRDVIFSGKVVRNPIHKCGDVAWDEQMYTMRAEARGKELRLRLHQVDHSSQVQADHTSWWVPRSMSIIFRFGMSGKFVFTPAQELLKHSHLSFFTKQSPVMAVSFVDPRRFGRENIVTNLHSAAFKKPICEVMLDQQYFNGIGNYLRAEILYRCQVPPFVAANTVLELQDGTQLSNSKYFKEEKSHKLTFDMLTPKAQELLQLCHTVPLEVVNLGCSKYTLLDLTTGDDDGLFANWLQCYDRAGMTSLTDHKKRTIWFSGPAGPLAPAEQPRKASRNKKTKPLDKVKSEVSEVSQNLKEEQPGEAVKQELLPDITASDKPKRMKPAARRTRHTPNTSPLDSNIESSTQQAASTTRKRLHKKRVQVVRDMKLRVLAQGNPAISTRVTRSSSQRDVISPGDTS